MKKRNIQIKYTSLAALFFILFCFCGKQQNNDEFITQLFAKKLPSGISIIYPENRTLFPPEIVAPTFLWEDKTQKSNAWYIHVSLNSSNKPFIAFTESTRWKPSEVQWNYIKEHSTQNEIMVSIAGIQKEQPHKIISGAEVSIQTSIDSVGASIFFRDVILPFDSARKHIDSIRYRLGDISQRGSHVLMSGLAVCGNCHSFSSDGKTMGMDIDYANDKGSYVISNIEKNTILLSEKIITWSTYKKVDKQPTFGLLSQISPDGRYVISTVKDRSVFVPVNNFAYSQLFFPIKGILVIYDRKTKSFTSLPGADNPQYVQSNPVWSPDGKYIYFARSNVYTSEKIENSADIVLNYADVEEFTSGRRDFKFDIYRIPFNEGKGGNAIPVEGASNNGMSNFFPKISPDGKWMVFTQAKNFMLLQQDSKLFIIPAAGGAPRLMTCNSDEMNSWHSWSPNGKWLVFSSKRQGPFTKLFLTHIDEYGIDAPAVCIENLLPENRAANIPEFVNRKFDSWQSMTDAFSKSGNYQFRIAQDMIKSGNMNGAESTLTIAAAIEPDNYLVFLERGFLHLKRGNNPSALQDFTKAVELSPNSARAHYNMAFFKNSIGDYSGAIKSYDKALELAKDNVTMLYERGVAKKQLGDFKGAIADLNKVIKIDPLYPEPYLQRGYAKFDMKDSIDGFSDMKMYQDLTQK